MSKDMILSCPAVGGERINTIKENISIWLSNRTLGDLVTAFDGTVPQNLTLGELAKWYLEFRECWDFRGRQKQAFDTKVGEGARWLLNNDDLSEYQKERALTAATELGLTNNSEPNGNAYDYIGVLGGAKLSCLLRSRLACILFLTRKSNPNPLYSSPQCVLLVTQNCKQQIPMRRTPKQNLIYLLLPRKRSLD
jgi:hypothetical protein